LRSVPLSAARQELEQLKGHRDRASKERIAAIRAEMKAIIKAELNVADEETLFKIGVHVCCCNNPPELTGQQQDRDRLH
jgi:hypothetical protein